MISKVAILNARDTLLLGNLENHGSLHCNEHNNVPVSIPASVYIGHTAYD